MDTPNSLLPAATAPYEFRNIDGIRDVLAEVRRQHRISPSLPLTPALEDLMPRSDMSRPGGHLRMAVRRVLRYRGAFVIVLWQVPLGPGVGPDGSFSLLFGGGSDEYVSWFSCEGPSQAERYSYRTAALEFEHDLSRRFRMEGIAALVSSDATGASTSFFPALQLRGDWKWVGAGAGVAVVPLLDPRLDMTGAAPSLHLRAGSATQLHARADVFPPSALGHQQIARVGAGWNATRRDAVSGFVGVGAVGLGSEADGFVADLAIPITAGAALRIMGHYGDGERHAVTGLAVGGRIMLPVRGAPPQH
jgi:hypothetical protein